jgi:RiboL-PSP-HEPN
MSYKEIRQIKIRIDDLVSRIKEQKSTEDVEVISDLSKYLCVLLSGYFDKGIADILFSYGGKFSPQIERCIQIDFKWITNIKMNKLLEILGQFSNEWKEEFVSRPEFEDYKDNLDSLVNNRNNIAHGIGSSVTLSELEYQYGIIEDILSDIKEIFCVYV